MIKKIAWETFKNTGDINAFIELKRIEGIEENSLNPSLEKKENISSNENSEK